MKNILMWIWQFPQNLVGFIYSRFAKNKSRLVFEIDGKQGLHRAEVYFCPCFHSGVSLGDYIILDPIYMEIGWSDTVRHEYGHSVQSKRFGWFYLLLVGLPSVVNNLWDRLFHKEWTMYRRVRWYHSCYPEKQADLLGGLNRLGE